MFAVCVLPHAVPPLTAPKHLASHAIFSPSHHPLHATLPNTTASMLHHFHLVKLLPCFLGGREGGIMMYFVQPNVETSFEYAGQKQKYRNIRQKKQYKCHWVLKSDGTSNSLLESEVIHNCLSLKLSVKHATDGVF